MRAHGFAELIALMHRLRAPGGCPWDADQSHESLKPYLIEEAYEALEAIDRGDDAALRDELGDVLLQVIFHAELADERGAFSIHDVVDTLGRKLVRRHPHVFEDAVVTTPAAVQKQWSEIKKAERADREAPSASLLGAVPRALPALSRAHRVGEKAASLGFDWPDARGAREKVDEELAEADSASRSENRDALAEELGDLLFAVASWARLAGFQAENLLEKSIAKFLVRFEKLEEEVIRQGTTFDELGAPELDRLWRAVKKAGEP